MSVETKSIMDIGGSISRSFKPNKNDKVICPWAFIIPYFPTEEVTWPAAYHLSAALPYRLLCFFHRDGMALWKYKTKITKYKTKRYPTSFSSYFVHSNQKSNQYTRPSKYISSKLKFLCKHFLIQLDKV